MKALLVIFAVYITYVICEGNKYAVRSFPKKAKPYGNGKILINTGKYVYSKPNLKFITEPSNLEKEKNNKYTVFQIVGVSKAVQGVPDSPYFPVEHHFDQKPRVKKILPDYQWSSLRSKRSAVLDPLAVQNNESKAESKTIEKLPEKELEKTEQSSLLPKVTPAPTPLSKTSQKNEKTQRKSAAEVDNKSKDAAESKEFSKNINPESQTPNIKPIERAVKTELSKETEKKTKSTKKTTDHRDDSTEVKSKKEPARNGDTKGLQTNANGKETDKTKGNKPKSNIEGNLRMKAKSKPGSATNLKAKLKNKNTKLNVRNKKKTKTNRLAKKKKNSRQLKRKGGNNQTAIRVAKGKGKSLKRTKNTRSKKGKRTKSVNGTRAGKTPKAQRRLIGAREALIEDYPYVISIQKNDQHWCSGALLNPRLAITTANCLWKASRISRMEVRAGSRDVNHGGQVARIQEVMKHPAWGLRKSPDNDVALILLDRDIKFSDSVHGVDLPNQVMMPPFDDAWVTSWGAERRDGVFDPESKTLQVYHTRLMDRDKCNNVTMRFSVIVTENFICLAQSGRTAPCTRDTGAPAVSDGILWGLASWGIRKLCGTERFPAVFSYLASHSNLEFITNATHFLMSDKRLSPFADRYPVKEIKTSSSSESSS